MKKLNSLNSFLFVAIFLFSTLSFGQTYPIECRSVLGTVNLPAPHGGSITFTNLDKYRINSSVCLGGTVGLENGISFSVALAFRMRNVSNPSCLGSRWLLNGGPVYSYMVGTGTVDIFGTGSINGTAYYQYDPASINFNGINYTLSSQIFSIRVVGTLAMGQITSVTYYIPREGVPMTVNGAIMNMTADIFGCLSYNPSIHYAQE